MVVHPVGVRASVCGCGEGLERGGVLRLPAVPVAVPTVEEHDLGGVDLGAVAALAVVGLPGVLD